MRTLALALAAMWLMACSEDSGVLSFSRGGSGAGGDDQDSDPAANPDAPACASDAECDGRCAPDGTCVECLTLGDCSNEDDLACSPSGECVDCGSNEHCPSERPVCEVASGECVQCLSDADCSGASCDPSGHECQ